MRKQIILVVVAILLVATVFMSGCVEQPPQPEPEIALNACQEESFGKPDFTGTPREGEGCMDNLDCQLHSPLGYTGNVAALECCQQDGSCYIL